MSVDYAKLDYRYITHHHRYSKRVESMPRKLVCQECRGAGGFNEPILDDGTGPWEPCGWCEGTGFVTPWLRGMWLRYQRRDA
jgi:DnaJ-class molecular chaperone